MGNTDKKARFTPEKGEEQKHSVPAVKQMIFYVPRWTGSKDLECLWWVFYTDL